MLANSKSTEPTETDETPTRYLVTCESCGFEHTAADRDEATVIGADHQRETSHEVLALEVPPALES